MEVSNLTAYHDVPPGMDPKLPAGLKSIGGTLGQWNSPTTASSAAGDGGLQGTRRYSPAFANDDRLTLKGL